MIDIANPTEQSLRGHLGSAPVDFYPLDLGREY